MATRKEEEKNERTIRGLLKLPENRRCINCNSLGPQYVCTNFWTFVCTTCSGIHREFTHRVKSVSMAKFSSQEVSSLQGGGNQRAKEIYFKEWDPQRSVPDSSNVDRLRDFIKHVYVDRRFTGEKGSDRPSRANTGDREDSYHSGSRSPPYNDAYDRRYSNRSSSGGRSPGYDQENRQYSDYKRSPGRPEIINDWRREDRFGNGRKVDEHRVSDGESRVGASPDRPKDLDTSSPPVVRPVREILGENVVPLQVGEPPKANKARLDTPPRTQRTASASSLGSTYVNPAEVKWENSASLIDFDSNSNAPTVTPPQVQPAIQAAPQPTSSTTDNNWASFDAVPEVKESQPPPAQPTPSVYSLDILSQLSVSAPVMHSQQPLVFPVSGVQSTHQSTLPVSEAPHVQPWSGSAAPSPQRPLTPALPQAPLSNPTNIVASGVMQNPPAEVKSNTRKELPADLFTALYAPHPAPVPMWQAVSPYEYGFNMHYNPTMMPLQPQPMPTYPVVSKSANPFDAKETSHAQAPMFPSMASLQGALPNEPPSSSMFYAAGAPPSAWTQARPPSYLTPVPSHAPGYVSTLPPGAYPGQQMLSTIPLTRSQGVGVGHANHPVPGSFSTSYGQPNPPASAGGNPFG